MKKKKQPEVVQLAVKIPASLDRAMELRCWQNVMLKREFVALAIRKLLEDSNA
jgi:hypothetical protein